VVREGVRSARAVWAICAGLAILGLAAELAKPATPDMGFLLYAARRVLDGAHLYRDVVEINPPLIIVLNLPIVLLARAIGLSEFIVYRVASVLFVGALLAYSARLIHRYVLPGQPARRRGLVLLLAFAVFMLPRIDFGQREHFVLALLLPYVLVAAGRHLGRTPGALEAAIIGFMAGAAVGLKPHFVLVWAAVEVFRRTDCSRAERWQVTPEMTGFACFLATYGLAVLWLTPDYLTVASLLGPAYIRYMREPFVNLLVLGPGAPLVGFVLLALVVLRRRLFASALGGLVAWSMVTCFIAGAVQQKGFRYHFYPALALAFVLLGLLAAERPASNAALSERLYSRASRALLGAIIAVVMGWAVLDIAGADRVVRQQKEEMASLVGAVKARAGGRPVGVLSYTIASAFPLVNYAGVDLASRFPHLWPLAATYWDAIDRGTPLRYHSAADMPPVERYFVKAVREDLLAAQPRLLIVLRPARDVPKNGLRRLHYVEYLERDPDLATFLSSYEFVEHQGEYLLYQRRPPDAPASGSAPSSAPGTQDVIRPELSEVRLGMLDPESLAGALVFGICWVLLAAADRRRARI